MLSIHRLKLKNLTMIAQLITLEPTVVSRGVTGGTGVGQGVEQGAGGGRDYSSTV